MNTDKNAFYKKEIEKIEEMRTIIVYEHNNSFLFIMFEKGNIVKIKSANFNNVLCGQFYIAKINNIQSGINACFASVNKNENVFIDLKEIDSSKVLNRKSDGKIKCQDEYLVQIIKEAHSNKCAVATGKYEISGSYSVISNIALGENKLSFSKKISKARKETISNLINTELFNNKILIRTAADLLIDDNELINEINNNSLILAQIENRAATSKYGSIIYDPADYIFNLIDNPSNTKIVTNRLDIYEKLNERISNNSHSVKISTLNFFNEANEGTSLNSLYGISSKIKELISKKVWLKSGGYIFIEPTEALTVIDVNSGKSEKGKIREDNILNINIEAAKTIAYHLYARNISGIIIIDFINMKSAEYITILTNELKKALNAYDSRTKVVDTTKLGLFELTRERDSLSVYDYIDLINETILM